MVHALVSLAVLSFTLAPLSAQLIVSPASAATTEGNFSNFIPFTGVTRYQQVHGDLRGTPFMMKGLQFRGDGSANSLARTIDLELLVSNGPYVGFSMHFDNNHGPARTHVFLRKMVNLPVLTPPTTPPAPFAVIYPFDVQYPHTGNADIVWEARIHATTSTASYTLDAIQSIPGNFMSRSGDFSGTGCIATGRTTQMLTDSQFQTFTTTAHSAVFWSVGGPASVASAILIGTTGASALPGLCTFVYVDVAAPLIAAGGMSDAGGVYAAGPYSLPYNLALVGQSLAYQSFALDVGRTDPIKVSASRRGTNQFPQQAPAGAPPIRRLILLNDATGPLGLGMDPTNVGLVTGFDR